MMSAATVGRSVGWPPGEQDVIDAVTVLREAGEIPGTRSPTRLSGGHAKTPRELSAARGYLARWSGLREGACPVVTLTREHHGRSVEGIRLPGDGLCDGECRSLY